MAQHTARACRAHRPLLVCWAEHHANCRQCRHPCLPVLTILQNSAEVVTAMAVRGLGCPVRFTPTASSEGRCTASRRIDRRITLPRLSWPIRPMTPITCAKPSLPRERSPSSPTTRHCVQISARQVSLCPAPSRGMLLLKAQAVPPRRNPLRKDRPKLPGHRLSCRLKPDFLAALAVLGGSISILREQCLSRRTTPVSASKSVQPRLGGVPMRLRCHRYPSPGG